jgi:hypothetical protein
MSKHTPAPWTLGKGKVRVRTEKDNDGRSKLIAECYTTGNAILYPSPEEREANARLIASAPELLEALKVMTDVFQPRSGEPSPDMHVETVAWEQARQAIAKAEGV